MDVVFDLRGSTYYNDTAIVTLFSSNAAQAAWPNAKKRKISTFTLALTWSRLSLRPLDGLVTTPKKFIKAVYPPTGIRDAWAAIQTTLHSSISQQLSEQSHHMTTMHPASRMRPRPLPFPVSRVASCLCSS